MTTDSPLSHESPPPQRGGVLVRPISGGAGDDAIYFIPAEVVVEVTALGAITRAPGLRPPAVGIALARGMVTTVLDLGGAAALRDASGELLLRRPETPNDGISLVPSAIHGRYRAGEDWPLPGADRAVLCNLDGEAVAVSGGSVVATGAFDAHTGDGVLWRGKPVPKLDVRALYAHAEAAIWAARAVSRPRGGAPL